MTDRPRYPKRLIEVDLPIKALSAQKSCGLPPSELDMRKTAIWWSRKPQNQARGVWLAAMLPDPADPLVSDAQRDEIREALRQGNLLSHRGERGASGLREDLSTLCSLIADPRNLLGSAALHVATSLLAKFAPPGTIALDPFAGSGSIGVEALRLGVTTVVNDYNPVSQTILAVGLQLGRQLSRRQLAQAEALLESAIGDAVASVAALHPPSKDSENPFGYIFFRSLRCEGPGCGRVVPATSKFLLQSSKKTGARFADAGPPGGRVRLELCSASRADSFGGPTIRQGGLACPVCGFVTPRKRVALQHEREHLQPILVAVAHRTTNGVVLREPTTEQLNAVEQAAQMMPQGLPPQEWPKTEPRRFSPPLYGYRTFAECHTARQRRLLANLVLGIANITHEDHQVVSAARKVGTLLTCRAVDANSSFCRWRSDRGGSNERTFAGKSVGMIWDFFEENPLRDGGGLHSYLDELMASVAAGARLKGEADVLSAPAQELPLPDDSVDFLYTDPPYYDAIPYAHLSDWLVAWAAPLLAPDQLENGLAPKTAEIAVDRPHSKSPSTHDDAYYHAEILRAFRKCREILKPEGLGVVVFAHKGTAAWENLLAALVDAGFLVTASWPIQTERGGRLQAQGTASLQSSVHLVCRPRENPDGSVRTDDIGDWRSVLAELPGRIHEWMPRLAKEGVVGADAIFACLGPALEIFSRYSRVEKASGEPVTLREYLEQVWAAVAREALTMIFEGADASGLEEDARLTAMWLWTLNAGSGVGGSEVGETDAADDEDQEEEPSKSKGKVTGYGLEFDAARKIAQGLGAHLENLRSLVEVKGETARLLPVAERSNYLFGKEAFEKRPDAKRAAKAPKLLELMGGVTQEEVAWADLGRPAPGKTTLDKAHQAMLLFGAGRAETLKWFLVDGGVGKDAQFWKLAQALSALYPMGSNEKRWVDGVLARKKGLGF